jgi:hypothetical protein
MESLKHLRICKKDWDDLPRVQVTKKSKLGRTAIQNRILGDEQSDSL